MCMKKFDAEKIFFDKLTGFLTWPFTDNCFWQIMVDCADIYFIQHFADIYFSKSVCISACGGYQVSCTCCQVSFPIVCNLKK